MKSKFAILAVTLVFVSLAALAQTGSTSVAPPTKVGVINIQQAILESNEGQRDSQVLAKKFEPKKTELENLGKELDGLKKQLDTQGDKLNDETRATLTKTIDQKQKTLQREMEDARTDYESQVNDLLNRIGGKMYKVIETYGQNNGYAVIFDISNPQSSGVLWIGQSVNLTKTIEDAYNAQSGVAAPPPAAPSATRPSGTAPAPRKPGTPQ